MNSIWLIPIVVMMGFMRILDLRKPSAAIILGPTSSLLVAKVLTGSRCEKPCGRAVSLQKRLNMVFATDQHALHFRHSDASWKDCLGLEIYLRYQPRGQCQCGRSLKNLSIFSLDSNRVFVPLGEKTEVRA